MAEKYTIKLDKDAKRTGKIFVRDTRTGGDVTSETIAPGQTISVEVDEDQRVVLDRGDRTD